MTFTSDEIKHSYFTLVSAGEQLVIQRMYLDCARASLTLHIEDVRTEAGRLEIIIRVRA